MFNYERLQKAVTVDDEAQLRQLYIPCHNDLVLYCLGKFKNTELAEDAASETLRMLLEHPNPAAIPNLKAWLLTVARNACIKAITTQQRREGILAKISGWFEKAQSPEAEHKLEEENLYETFKALLNQKDYYIFISEQQGYKDDEIANQLQMSAKTVANRKSMIKKQLKDKLGHYQSGYLRI